MRYLKPYKLFESSDSNLIEDIKYIFLELEDEGYNINVKDCWRFSDSYEIKINKRWVGDQVGDAGYPKEEFLLRNVCDSILILESYLKDTIWYIYEIRGYHKNKRYGSRRHTDLYGGGNRDIAKGHYLGIDKNISWVKNIDPNSNFQEPNEVLDMSLIEVGIILRKKK